MSYGVRQVCRIVRYRGQYQFLEVDFFSATYDTRAPVQNNLGGPDQLAGNTKERPIQEETRKNIFRGERGPSPPSFGNDRLKRGPGF